MHLIFKQICDIIKSEVIEMKKNNFKVLRVKAGLTQDELAKKAGVSRPTVARFEADDKELLKASFSNIIQLSIALEVGLDEIYDCTKEK